MDDENLEPLTADCYSCKQTVERDTLSWERIENRDGYYCESCLDGWDHYVNCKRSEMKEERLDY
jgi:hypothetical protein